MKVLILAHDFPPLNTIGARRPYSWFQHFPKYGIHPVVITKSWEDASSSVHEIASQQGAKRITIEEDEQRTLVRVPLKKTFSERLISRYGEKKFRLIRRSSTFFIQILSHLFPTFDKNYLIYKAAIEYLKDHSVDLIIATGEPFILFKYGRLLKKKYHIPWIADYRDGWYLNHITAQTHDIALTVLWQLEFFFEKKYIASCKFITSVDPLLCSRLQELHRKNAFVIYNGFEELSEPAAKEAAVNGLPLLLCYGGTLYSGHQAEALFRAIDELHTEKKIVPGDLKLLFLGIEFFHDQYERVIGYSPFTSQYVETTRRLPFKEATRILRNADFLIVFTDKWTPVLPSKMYEYIAARKPVLVILNDHSILEELIISVHGGIIINTVDELKKFLVEKIKAKKNQQPLFTDELDELKANKYSREIQAAELAALIKSHIVK